MWWSPDRRNRYKACSQILQHRIFPALTGHQDSTSSACSPCISPVCLYLPNLPAEAGNKAHVRPVPLCLSFPRHIERPGCAGVSPRRLPHRFTGPSLWRLPGRLAGSSLPCGRSSVHCQKVSPPVPSASSPSRSSCGLLAGLWSRLSSSPQSGGVFSEAPASLLARGKVASPAIVLGSAWSSARRCFFPWLSSSGALEESVPLRRVAFRFPRHSARIFLRIFHACCNIV